MDKHRGKWKGMGKGGGWGGSKVGYDHMHYETLIKIILCLLKVL